jgi:hypothetical protein
MSGATEIQQLSDARKACGLDFEYRDWVARIFGLVFDDGTERAMLIDWLKRVDDALLLAATGSAKNLAEPERLLRTLQSVAKDDKSSWKNGPIKILCDDHELHRIALLVEAHGTCAFSKTEFEERFDLTETDPFWTNVPDYTIVIVGGGKWRFISPEWDRGEHADEIEIAARERHRSERQVVVNACLFVEAFVNSIAYTFRCRRSATLSVEDDLYLRERKLDPKTGNECERRVALNDKLHGWVKLVSPRNDTFDKGHGLYQEFRKLQEYRDSIVHLSATKIEKYFGIDLSVAEQAVEIALGIAKAICGYIASDPNAVAYPRWLAKPGAEVSERVRNLLGIN